MADYVGLEDGSGHVLLEDGTGGLLLEAALVVSDLADATGKLLDLSLVWTVSYLNPTVYEYVYGTDLNVPPPTNAPPDGGEAPDPDDAPVPPDEPDFTGEIDAEQIVVSFTDNMQDEPVWTAIG